MFLSGLYILVLEALGCWKPKALLFIKWLTFSHEILARSALHLGQENNGLAKYMFQHDTISANWLLSFTIVGCSREMFDILKTSGTDSN